jgi:thioredoxin-related protein
MLLATGISLSLILLGCDNKVATAQSVETPKQAAKVVPNVEEKKVPSVASTASGVFLDNATIQPNGKPMLVVFGAKECQYCEVLKKDIKETPELESILLKEFSTYYVGMDTLSEHNLVHETQTMKTTNKMLAEIYGISATPTLIFYDEKGQSVFRVPGYMPKKQFLVTLAFMKEKAWGEAARNSPEMYEKIKAYYAQNGIIK